MDISSSNSDQIINFRDQPFPCKHMQDTGDSSNSDKCEQTLSMNCRDSNSSVMDVMYTYNNEIKVEDTLDSFSTGQQNVLDQLYNDNFVPFNIGLMDSSIDLSNSLNLYNVDQYFNF